MPDLFLSLREQLTGSLVTGTGGWWDVARAAWVVDGAARPSAVVHARTADDVAATVRFARAHRLQVTLTGDRSVLQRPPAPGTVALDLSLVPDPEGAARTVLAQVTPRRPAGVRSDAVLVR